MTSEFASGTLSSDDDILTALREDFASQPSANAPACKGRLIRLHDFARDTAQAGPRRYLQVLSSMQDHVTTGNRTPDGGPAQKYAMKQKMIWTDLLKVADPGGQRQRAPVDWVTPSGCAQGLRRILQVSGEARTAVARVVTGWGASDVAEGLTVTFGTKGGLRSDLKRVPHAHLSLG